MMYHTFVDRRATTDYGNHKSGCFQY